MNKVQEKYMLEQFKATLELNNRAASRIDNSGGSLQIISGLAELTIEGVDYQVQIVYAPKRFHVPSDIVTIRKEAEGVSTDVTYSSTIKG